MSAAVSLVELQNRGVAPKPHEAVAIVLSLLEHQPCTGAAEKTDGRVAVRPALASISLSSDGAVADADSAVMDSPGDAAALLQQLLGHTPQVPPGLLYGIARALRSVEAPAFDSMDAFVKLLRRFQRGANHEVIAALVTRYDDMAATQQQSNSVRPERRRTPPFVKQLRAELRASDRARYEREHIEHAAAPAARRALPAAPLVFKRFSPAPFAACVLLGLATLAVGDAIRATHPPAAAAVVSNGSDIVLAPSAPAPSRTVDVSKRSVDHTRAASYRRATAPAPHSASRFSWLKRFITIRRGDL